MTWKILQGDALQTLKALPSDYFHCVVTSPPYYALRDYGIEGQMGLEPTLKDYIAGQVALFEEVKRVLRPDGTCWLNIGDSYCAASGKRATKEELEADKARKEEKGYYSEAFAGYSGWDRSSASPDAVLKPKDLCLVPFRLAIALQESGWWVRNDIIWEKLNPMPESATDRLSRCHEYMFLLTKSASYYFDQEAIKEPVADSTPARALRAMSDSNKYTLGAPGQCGHSLSKPRPNMNKFRSSERYIDHKGKDNDNAILPPSSYSKYSTAPETRKKRDVWHIATQSFSGSHFATFPFKLVEPCILAGTSEMGCCASCDAPRRRILRPSDEYAALLGKGCHNHEDDGSKGQMQPKRADFESVTAAYVTVGWEKTCQCDTNETVPCRVLDPFAGAGTTLLMAQRLGRDSVGIELNPEYIKLAEQRIINDSPLFNGKE